MSKVNVYTPTAAKPASTTFPKEMVADPNDALLAQAMYVYEDRQHPGTTSRKTRGEVTGSRRKIYKQKGTGNARHGARSAPIFVAGGKAHGPRGIKRVKLLPKKMKRKALAVALGMKVSGGELVLVDKMSTVKKASDARALFEKIEKGQKASGARMSVFLSEKNKDVYKVAKNFKSVDTKPFSSINAYNVVKGGLLVIDKEALKTKEK